MFGGTTVDDPLYAAVSAGQRYPGVEHWLAFFYEALDHLAAYTEAAPFVFDDQAKEAFADRPVADLGLLSRRARMRGAERRAPSSAAPYKPVPPEQLYEIERAILPGSRRKGGVVQLSPFATPDASAPTMPVGGWRRVLRPSGRRRTSTCSRRW